MHLTYVEATGGRGGPQHVCWASTVSSGFLWHSALYGAGAELYLRGLHWDVSTLLGCEKRGQRAGKRRPTEIHCGTFEISLILKRTSVMPGPWPCSANKQATLSSFPINKLLQNKKKQKKNTPMWELSLSQASFHSLWHSRWQMERVAFHVGEGVGGKGFLSYLTIIRYPVICVPQWHQGLVILRQKS